jgi:hypothetical protein
VYISSQVIKAFGDPKFFNVIFPLLFGMCDSTAANKSGSALASDAAKTGFIQMLYLCYIFRSISLAASLSFINT